MSAQGYSISIAEVSFNDGPKKNIRVKVDGRDIGIPVENSVFAYFREQFLREHPTPQQKRRFVTVMNVVRAAYQQGLKDAKKSNGHSL